MIKSCPFCGSPAELHKGHAWYYIECTGCRIRTPMDPDNLKLLAEWNRRHIETAVVKAWEAAQLRMADARTRGDTSAASFYGGEVTAYQAVMEDDMK